MTDSPATPGRMPVLVNLNTQARFTLNSPSASLGRAPENDVVLPEDGYASADHARVYFDQGRWWVEDLMSSNGTFVNDKLLGEPWPLSPNDLIKVGRTIFRIE
ncbi:MAG: FHA domain-containing protein [Cyanobacteria bacterium REEB67]|nr:FHA domain-containing protein [Cyanobacteria bacterium REEB67]